MNSSFAKIFIQITLTSFIVLATIELLINEKNEVAHAVGWFFVATFIGALIGIIKQKNNH